MSPRRAACLEILDTVIAHAPGGLRGTAVFVLDCEHERDAPAGRNWRPPQEMLDEAARRLQSAAPPWHRLLRGDADEFVVIAQGLVDGGAVLAAAARLVHAFDDALQASGARHGTEVAIGIAFTPQHGAQAESLLSAAEAGLRDAKAAAGGGMRRGGG